MRLERLEDRALLTALPYGADVEDTGEFMLGSVLVTPVFMESVGTVNTQTQDVSTEDWTPARIAETKQRIEEGLQWWVDTLAARTDKHSLNFQLDYTYADDPVETLYEPINRPSTAYQDWTVSFLNAANVNLTGDVRQDIWDFNHAQRIKHGTNWAFTIFVVNSTNDLNDGFEYSNNPGEFPHAFSFAGGRFIVYPSERPASTVAHEVAHMFWGLDEYEGSGSWNDKRGYYNTQNLNAIDDNPADPFVQADSIMSNGASLQNAYDDNTSPASTLAMIGWQDSDGDGVFDVLDVPLTLSGFGYLDPEDNIYRFRGHSSVQTLPNRNPSGNGNDVTINRVSRAEYRVDGGPWQLAATYDEYSADLNLSIGPLTAGRQTVEIRTVDAVSGVGSPVFTGSTERPARMDAPGINGSVWNDADADGQWDNGETGVAGAGVQLLDADGDPLNLTQVLEPDDHTSDFQLINYALPGVVLTSVGSGVADSSVLSRVGATSSTGSRVFAHFRVGNQVATEWTPVSRRLRIDFNAPVSAVRLDAVGVNGGDFGRLEAYDANDQLLARYTTRELDGGQVETMVLEREQADIAYAIAGGHAASVVRLDALRVGPLVETTTDAFGGYRFAGIPTGDYRVEVVPPDRWTPTSPDPARRIVSYQSAETLAQVDFGGQVASSAWQNPDNRYDVNDDETVAPVDVLQIINDLNTLGSRLLPAPTGENAPPPYLDASGDGFVAPNDALAVINYLNAQSSSGGGEGEASGGSQPGAASEGEGEGEGEHAVAPFLPVAGDVPPVTNGLGTRDSILATAPERPAQQLAAFQPPAVALNRGTADGVSPVPRPVAEGGAGGAERLGSREWEELLDRLAEDVTRADDQRRVPEGGHCLPLQDGSL